MKRLNVMLKTGSLAILLYFCLVVIASVQADGDSLLGLSWTSQAFAGEMDAPGYGGRKGASVEGDEPKFKKERGEFSSGRGGFYDANGTRWEWCDGRCKQKLVVDTGTEGRKFFVSCKNIDCPCECQCFKENKAGGLVPTATPAEKKRGDKFSCRCAK